MELPHLHHLNPYLQVNLPPPPEASCERLPQWTHDETREFLAIRAQLDKTFSETKRNKPLWEAISSMLQQRGFFRTPDQCKSKWKNLVTRFKGSGTTVEGEANRQFPFYEEMRSIFAERIQRGKGVVQVQVKESEEEEQEDEGQEAEGRMKRRKVERKKKKKKSGGEEVEDALREFMRRQLEMEARWVEAAEAREAERRATEEEWRSAMVGLREERMQMERRWREQEEERRAREEARAERRHALVMALLDKIAQDL
ncbi:trihelix transcription factor GT-3b-like [Canna indica]|uniref:Trihelix transcription factor GT-3b-like n=1 Tax=Canna indica TaxID=4628 RepID=A0AAQ3KM31_9LILI|nr:trihelix transcription factor GT-3b-like [Canna indica]